EIVFELERKPDIGVDVVLERCIQHSRALYSLWVFGIWGIPTVNTFEVADICGNKLLTTMRLIRHGVPSPRTRVAFTPESALVAAEELGYPVVMKPLVGSWGRLISKVNDREAAEAILEHKDVLGTYMHSIYYVQEYVPKPGRDIRAFVVGDETIAAIYRYSDHWITNTARGGKATKCVVTPELNEVCVRAARAVGGGGGALVAGSESLAGKPVTTAHPNLRKRTDLQFVRYEDVTRCDVLFLSLPNGTHRADEFDGRAELIIDLSSDHRLTDPADYQRWYGEPHPHPHALGRWVYGIPELHRARIAGAKRVTGAGCNATAAILALLPLFAADVV